MNQSDKYDLAIIGAGITGVGVAIAAREKGLNFVLIDPNGLATETSANSLKIMHGGFRYLQNLDLMRTVYSLGAQAELLERYPTLVKELDCIMPLAKFGLKSKYPAACGGLLYHLLLKAFSNKTIKSPKVISSKAAKLKNNLLADYFKNSALTWSDAALTSHEELIKQEFKDSKNLIKEKVVKVSKQDSHYDIFTSAQNIKTKNIKAKKVVNTASYGQQNITLENIKIDLPKIYWAKAFNFIFEKPQNFNLATGISSSEGRLFFLVPRESTLAVGTFYAKLTDLNDLKPTEADIRTAEDILFSTIPEIKSDYVRIEQGILPCQTVYDSEKDLLDRDLITQVGDYISVFSPKYTTFLPLGRKIVAQL